MDTSNRTGFSEKDAATIDDVTSTAKQKLDQLGEIAAEKGQEIKEGAALAAEAAQEMLKSAGEKLSDYAKATDQSIRKNPYPAIGIALGVGLLCGFLFKRK